MKVSILILLFAPLVAFGLSTKSSDDVNEPGLPVSKSSTRGLLSEKTLKDTDDPIGKPSSKGKGKVKAKGNDSEDYGGITFGTCSSGLLQQYGILCGSVKVPLDYDHPRGKQIQLAVSLLAHRDAEDYRGIMIVNPGGPGGQGLIWAVLALFIDPAVAAKYDWIGWDPRGVGESIPSLSCRFSDGLKPPYAADYLDEWLKRGKDFAKACFKDQRDLLPHMSTVNDARDMDSIREALGAEILNFYGFSYGTAIGQVYATLYPAKVGKFVLDGVVNYNGGAYETTLDRAFDIELVIDKFFDWVSQFDVLYRLGTDGAQVREKFLAAEQAIFEYPIGGLIGPAELIDFFGNFLTVHRRWPESAQLLSDWIYSNNETPLIEAYRSFAEVSGNVSSGTYSAITCTESANGGWPEYSDAITDFARAFEAGARIAIYPVFYSVSQCYSWDVNPAPAFSVARNYENEILFISLEFDTRTPLSGALIARDNFRKSVLVNVPGAVGRAESILAGQSCLEAIVAEYLDSGVLPSRKPARGVADYDCEGRPLPDPLVEGRRTVVAASQETDELAQLREMLITLLQSNNKIGL